MKYRDSVYVFFTRDTLYSLNSPSVNLNFQDIITGASSSLDKDTISLSTSGIVTGLLLSSTRKISNEYSASCYILPPSPILEKQGYALHTGPVGQYTIFDTIYSVLELDDLNFIQVIRANNNTNLAYNGTPTLIYSAKHIGIVRKEFPEYNQVWNLVKYNIVQ